MEFGPKIAAAFVKAQEELKNPLNSDANPITHSRYASLPSILNEIRPILTKHKLSLIQNVGSTPEGHVYCQTILLHESGEHLKSDKLCSESDKNKRMNSVQEKGSSITYLRRYQLSALLNIASEEDTDGNKTSGKAKTGNGISGKAQGKPGVKPADKPKTSNKPVTSNSAKAKPSPKSNPKPAAKTSKKPAPTKRPKSRKEITDASPSLEEEVPKVGLEKACKNYPLMRNIKKAFNLDGTLFTEKNIRNELIDDERCPPEKVDEIMNLIMGVEA